MRRLLLLWGSVSVLFDITKMLMICLCRQSLLKLREETTAAETNEKLESEAAIVRCVTSLK